MSINDTSSRHQEPAWLVADLHRSVVRAASPTMKLKVARWLLMPEAESTAAAAATKEKAAATELAAEEAVVEKKEKEVVAAAEKLVAQEKLKGVVEKEREAVEKEREAVAKLTATMKETATGLAAEQAKTKEAAKAFRVELAKEAAAVGALVETEEKALSPRSRRVRAATQAEAEAKARAEAQAEAEAKAQTAVLVKARAGAHVEIKAQAEAEAQARAEAEAKAEAKAQAAAVAKALAEAQLAAEAQAVADAGAKAAAAAAEAAEADAKANAAAVEAALVVAKAQADGKAAAEAAELTAAKEAQAKRGQTEEKKLEVQNGCYLFFTEARGGAFILHWSETLPEGSEGYEPLAHFRPEGTVGKFKYTTNGGQSELCKGVGGPNKKLFYQGWASFLRTAFSHNGTLTFLRNVEACPVAILFCKSDTSVLRFEKDTPLKLTADIVAVAVTPSLATGLDVHKMPTRNFASVGERLGAAFSLDGGGDGKAENVPARVARSKSFACVPAMAAKRPNYVLRARHA